MIGIGDGVGVLTVMGNEGMGEGRVMEGWEVNGRVMIVCILFSYIERVFGGVIERMVIHL